MEIEALGEMVRLLRELAALAEVSGLVPRTHSGQLAQPAIPIPGVLTPSPGLLGHLHSGDTHAEKCVRACVQACLCVCIIPKFLPEQTT